MTDFGGVQGSFDTPLSRDPTETLAEDQDCLDTPSTYVPGEPIQGRAKSFSKTTPSTPSPDALLDRIRTCGAMLDNFERARIKAHNQIGAYERKHESVPLHFDLILGGLDVAENEARLELIRAWRLHPLSKWCKGIHGVGEKSIARLIAHTGDPATRPNPAKFLAYCGLGDPSRKPRKGMTQEEVFQLGNPAAKKQCWLVGEAFVKQTKSPYRAIYDEWREKYAEKTHDEPCRRCGPSGKPAPAGSPWSLKHQHEAAKRNTVKRFLVDLWVASREAG